jgi:ketosteroid isomerase-like protein
VAVPPLTRAACGRLPRRATLAASCSCRFDGGKGGSGTALRDALSGLERVALAMHRRDTRRVMSQENVELVRRGTESVEAFWAMLDEFVVWDLRAYPLPDLEWVYVGRDAVIAGSRHYWGTWDDYRLDVEQLIDAGPSVVAVVHERGSGKGSGAAVERRLAQVWTLIRGRLIRWELFQDKAQAFEAVGLSE